MTKPAPKLVSIKPLKPFVGSYECAPDDPDAHLQIVKEAGTDGAVKVLHLYRKRFAGTVAFERAATSFERDSINGVGPPLASNIELVSREKLRVIEHPLEPIIRVPEATAADLIARGLVCTA